MRNERLIRHFVILVVVGIALGFLLFSDAAIPYEMVVFFIVLAVIIIALLKVSREIVFAEEERKQGVIFLWSCYFLLIILNSIAPANPNVLCRIYASLTILFSALPTYFFLVDKKKCEVAFMPLFGWIYAMYYGFPIFTLEEYKLAYYKPGVIADIFVEKAAFLSLIGISVLLFAYYRWPGRDIYKYIPKVTLHWDLKKVKINSIIIGFLGVMVFYSDLWHKLPAAFQQIVCFLSDFTLISIGMLFILQLKGLLNDRGGAFCKFFLWGFLVPTRMLLGLGYGATLQAIQVVLLLLLIYITIAKRIPWKFLCVSLIVLAFMISMRSDFRKDTWSGHLKDTSLLQKTGTYVEMFISKSGSKDGFHYQETFQIFSSRVCGLMIFAHVISLTPEFVPYLYGESYKPMLYKLIPRIIYPYKPKDTAGDFGHRYSIINSQDSSTTITFLQTVEMHANFGALGVIIGMFIMGIIYRSIIEIFGKAELGDGSLIIAFFIFTQLLKIEGHLSAVVGGVLYPAILLILFNKFFLTEKYETRA